MISEIDYGMDPQGRLRFYGLYTAKVLDNTDPLGKGRLRLQVFQPTGKAMTVWADQCLGFLAQPNYPYGTFLSLSTQNVSGANTATPVTLSMTEDSGGGISLSGGGIKVSEEGDYFLQFSAVFKKANANTTSVDIWLRKNGVDIPRTNTSVEVSGNPGDTTITVGFILDLEPNDTVGFAFSSPDANMQLAAKTGLTNPTRPDIPSIIATINLVGRYVPKPGTKVWVMFEAGDPEYPVWIGAVA